MPFTAEERKTIEKAAAYRRMKDGGSYKQLLDMLEEKANARLASVRGCKSADPKVTHEFHRNWRSYEDVLTDIQLEVETTISEANGILKDEMQRSGISPQDAEQLIEENVLITEEVNG